MNAKSHSVPTFRKFNLAWEMFLFAIMLHLQIFLSGFSQKKTGNQSGLCKSNKIFAQFFEEIVKANEIEIKMIERKSNAIVLF